MQERVQQYLNYRRPYCDDSSDNGSPKNGGKLIRVPIPTFPPTAVLYSIDDKNTAETRPTTDDSANYVSAAIMAKILEEREKERLNGNKESFDTSTQTGERNEFFIQMDDPGNGGGFNRTPPMFHSKSPRSNDYPVNSQTVLRGPYSKSNQNETIII